MFCSKIVEKHACNPSMLFDASNHRNSQNVPPNGLEWWTPNPPKIDENPYWEPPVSPLVNLCPFDNQNAAKMVPKDSQMDQKCSPGTQKNTENQQTSIIKY